MLNWKEYILNGVEFTLRRNTKRHVLEVHFGALGESPSMIFTRAKGEAIIEFLTELMRVQKNDAVKE